MEWYSVSDIAQKTRIPAPTARRYSALFREFLPSRKIGRVTKYAEEAIEIFEKISKLYADGHVTAEIEEMLRRDYARTIEVSPVVPSADQSAVATVIPSDMARTLNNVLDKFGTCLEIIADQKSMIETQRSDILKLKTAFVLLARSQKKLKTLPQETQATISDELAQRTQRLERKDLELEEMTLNLSFDQSDLKAKLQILESELVRLRKDRREMEQFFRDKIERIKS